MTQPSPARHDCLTLLSIPMANALEAVSQIETEEKSSSLNPALDISLLGPPDDEPAEGFSFLRYIPSPQEEYEYLYKVFTEAEASWE